MPNAPATALQAVCLPDQCAPCPSRWSPPFLTQVPVGRLGFLSLSFPWKHSIGSHHSLCVTQHPWQAQTLTLGFFKEMSIPPGQPSSSIHTTRLLCALSIPLSWLASEGLLPCSAIPTPAEASDNSLRDVFSSQDPQSSSFLSCLFILTPAAALC